jgi:hypothetical protein
MSSTRQGMKDEQRQVVINLHISDQQSHGLPELRGEEARLARDWLVEMLPDWEKLSEHLALLAQLYEQVFRATRQGPSPGETQAPGNPTFRHCELLSEEQLTAIGQRGPVAEVLSDAELARLLLNPFALYDLSEWICTTIPDWWVEPLAEVGQELVARHDLVLPPSRLEPARSERELTGAVPQFRGRGKVVPRGNSLEVGFGEDSRELQRRIATTLYGNPEVSFVLLIHRRGTGAGDSLVVELEVSPAPVHEDLQLTIDFKGHVRTFLVQVPPSVRLDPEADPPARVVATATEPVPAEGFELEPEAEWRDETWPPHLKLR